MQHLLPTVSILEFLADATLENPSIINAITGQNLAIVSDVKGTTTDNREIIFIGCRYNSCILIYKALIISDYNTGIYPEITKFDRICFEGRAVNTFAGPGRAFTSEKVLIHQIK